MNQDILLGAYVFILAIFVGVEVIGRIPSTLHTPLMSATNAIHGIVFLGAILICGTANSTLDYVLAFIGLFLGAGNVFGGFVVTDRMLEMFKKKPVEKR